MTETRIPVTTASPTWPQQGPLGAVLAIAWLAQIMEVIDSAPGGFPDRQGEDALEDDLVPLAQMDAGPRVSLDGAATAARTSCR